MTLTPESSATARTLGRVTRSVTGADIMEQLAEEIRKQYGGRGGVKAFAADLDVNYWTYRNYLTGKTSMGADLLMDSLTALGVDPAVFFVELRARIADEG